MADLWRWLAALACMASGTLLRGFVEAARWRGLMDDASLLANTFLVLGLLSTFLMMAAGAIIWPAIRPKKETPTGWRCPRCARVWSPDVKECHTAECRPESREDWLRRACPTCRASLERGGNAFCDCKGLWWVKDQMGAGDRPH